MHFLLKGLLFYIAIVILQIAIFSIILGIIAFIEFVYKKCKERSRENRRREREEFLKQNAEKSVYIEDKTEPIAEVMLNQAVPENEISIIEPILDTNEPILDIIDYF